MRITRQKKQENHDRIVTAASGLFRERGFDGVGVADLMEQAGLTHGGFYNHFASKEDLVTEAVAKGFSDTASQYAGIDAVTAIELYVSRQHRDSRGQGCTLAALGCEAARQSPETRSVFNAGIEGLIGLFQEDMVKSHAAGPDARAQAISVLAQAVGALILSRACPDDSALADEILDACRPDCLDAIENRARER